MGDTVSRKALLDWIKTRREALEAVIGQHTGYHKRHLSGQHSALVDLEWELEEGQFSTESEGEATGEYIVDEDRGRLIQGDREWHIVPDTCDISADEYFDEYGGPKWLLEQLAAERANKYFWFEQYEQQRDLCRGQKDDLRAENERLRSVFKRIETELSDDPSARSQWVVAVVDEALKEGEGKWRSDNLTK